MSDKHDKAAGKVQLCSGCEMAGRMCDDCREYAPARANIAAALRRAAADEREALREAVSDEAQALGMVRARTTEMIFENACEAVDAARGTEQGNV